MTRRDADGIRHKTGGRQKGTPNKASAAIREAMLAVFEALQARAGGNNAHMLKWAEANSTDFYKLASKLLPLQITGEDSAPILTRIELVAPDLPLPTGDRGAR